MAKSRNVSSDTPAAPAADHVDDVDQHDRIAQRAYELYLERGGADGGDFDDWLAAEREVAASNERSPRGDAGE